MLTKKNSNKAKKIIDNFLKRIKKAIYLLSFDGVFYLNFYKDIMKSRMDPKEHYIKYGFYENRFRNIYAFSKSLNFILPKNYKVAFTKKVSIANNIIFNQSLIDLENTEQCSYSDGKIAVHVHLYYIELMEEIISYLKNIPFQFDVYISTRYENKEIDIEKSFKTLNKVDKCIVKICKNRGRDIYPLISTFADEIKDCKYLLHIHTKQSLSSEQFFRIYFWRRYLFEHLLGSREAIKRILALLRKEKTGLVFPEPYFVLTQNSLSSKWWSRFPQNEFILKKIRAGVPDFNIYFPAGTMFWCKTEAIKPFLEANFSENDFSDEISTINDGSPAHAIERLFGIVSITNGFRNFIIRSKINKYFNTDNIVEAKKNTYYKTFDGEFYISKYPEYFITDQNYIQRINPIEHYKVHGFNQNLQQCASYSNNFIDSLLKARKFATSNFIDNKFYLRTYFDAANIALFDNISPFIHYQKIGKKCGFEKNQKALQDIKKKLLAKNYSFAFIVRFTGESFAGLDYTIYSICSQSVEKIHVFIECKNNNDKTLQILRFFKNKFKNILFTFLYCDFKEEESIVKIISQIQEDYFVFIDTNDWIDLNLCEDLFYISEAYKSDCVRFNCVQDLTAEKLNFHSQPPLNIRIINKDISETIQNNETLKHQSSNTTKKYFIKTKSFKQIIEDLNSEECNNNVITLDRVYEKIRVIVSIDNAYYHSLFKWKGAHYKNFEEFRNIENNAIDFSPKVSTNISFSNIFKLIAILVPAPSSEDAKWWGDYHFAIALKKALENIGYQVSIKFRNEWNTPFKEMIVIVLRGLAKYIPRKNNINIMWNISHPDMIDDSEYNMYDMVFISSISHAIKIKKKNFGPTDSLLQCTDPSIFNVMPNNNKIYDVIFVGNSRNIYRTSMQYLFPSNLKIGVWGRGWEKYIDKKYIVDQSFENIKLGALYNSSKIVLNDHWEDMKNNGFISNRLFDGFVSNAFVLTDHVEGIEKVFPGIITYKNKKDFNDILLYYLENNEQREKYVERMKCEILKKHTFEIRALQIDKYIKNLQGLLS